jgi:sulfite exporter TauE/SafE
MIIDLPLIAIGGVLGSSHCIGMCGAFAVSIGLGARSVKDNAARQLVYGSGRVFSYAFLGASAGFAGYWFARRTSMFVHAQAILSVVAGVLLILQGSGTLRLIPRARWLTEGSGGSCAAGSFVGPFLGSSHWYHVFLAGVFNGFLPCGLVYGYLALASASASLTRGLLTMAAFGAGTVPLMVLAGVGSSFLSFAARRRMFRVAGVCVLLTGVLAVGRGLLFWKAGDSTTCPACGSGSSTLISPVLDALAQFGS